MDVTARFELPLLVAGQAQKEIFHNEALERIATCIGASVTGPASATPPDTPSVGDCFLVGTGASAAWTGKDNAVAAFREGGWRFISPCEGFSVWVQSRSTFAVFRGGAWEYGALRGDRIIVDGTQVVGSQQSSIPTPAAGSNIDVEARVALGQILGALRTA